MNIIKSTIIIFLCIKYMGTNEDKIIKLKKLIQETDTILIGAGAGLSTSAGMLY